MKNSFSKEYLSSTLFHPSTTWFLSQCGEARGMQEMWKKVRPEILRKLKESAIIQSTESSNRIEGVEVEPNRLIPLVLGKTKPKDRSEEEIAGYRKALSYIHKNYSQIEINPKTIKLLHEMAQGGLVGDAGKWKIKDNDIIEITPRGERFVRFKPVPASKTPKAIEQLCLGYHDVTNNSQLPELISVSNFVLDFLCIHPFRDGNGRVSRLLTLLLLYQQGYEVGRYISLEKIIENTKEDYYKVLAESSTNWHDNKHNLMPWWNYFLGTIKTAYQDLKERVELSSTGDNQSSLIRQTIMSFDVPFSISDIQNIHPGINRDLIKKVLMKLNQESTIKMSGAGRAAKWKVSR
jgi:Fic family protein